MTSADGITWALHTAAMARQWTAVAFGNGVFAAVAQDGANPVMYSATGAAWTQGTAPTKTWGSLAFGNGVFVAVAPSGLNPVMTSADGITWVDHGCPAGTWNAVAFGNGVFVAVGSGATNKVMTSTDGVAWTARTAAAAKTWRDVAWSPDLGVFVAVAQNVGADSIMTSPDGVAWSLRVNPATTDAFGNPVSGPGLARVCAAPGIGFVAGSYSASSYFVRSTDGVTWTNAGTQMFTVNSADLEYGMGLFVSMGDGALRTSPDGITWTLRTGMGGGWRSFALGTI